MSVEVKGPGQDGELPANAAADNPDDDPQVDDERPPCPATMGAEEMIALTRKHTMFSWVAQNVAEPIAVETAKGVWFCSADGKRYLDFNSQAMSVNIGHGNERVADAIAAQARKLAYAYPHAAHEPRARLGAKLAELTPGDLDVMFFTTGGADASTRAGPRSLSATAPITEPRARPWSPPVTRVAGPTRWVARPSCACPMHTATAGAIRSRWNAPSRTSRK
jgi:taurine--2-oxoglutarate transaminase